jgi:hypothetical protein
LLLYNSATVGSSAQLPSGTCGTTLTTQCSCGVDAATLWSNAQNNNLNSAIAASLDSSGSLQLVNSQSLTLAAGNYVVNNLEIVNSAQLEIRPGATVNLFVKGTILVANNGALVADPNQGSHVTIYANGSGSTQLDNSSDARIDLYAPASDVQINNSADFFGAIVGNTIAVNNGGSYSFSP